ncbi:MAG TPA: hypothetical protein VK958_10890 [Methylophilus sp.]|uniref:hypothetical protein n=1 Tax=Methylophilus sp. TaxID=29541 RepID=UPI002C66DD0F|nr:hypothetical protein [Methylophilus sp.]HSH87740.1 hypothetical protein [Methylophilus sp.]
MWQSRLFLLRRLMPLLVASLGLTLGHPTQALIHGLTFPGMAISTVKLSIQHAHFLQSIEKWEYYDSICSAAIVGRKPLTLLTAAHCLKEVRLTGPLGLPMLSIAQPELLGIEDIHLKQAFYRPFEQVSEDLTQDIAVLVFDAKVIGPIQSLRIRLDDGLPDTIMICGYGRGYGEADTRHPRCGERKPLRDLSDFYQVLPKSYREMDEMLHLQAQTQFAYTQELVHAEKALLAVNRLNEMDQYDHTIAMPTVGDSGGPWLVLNTWGQYELLGITSLVERFYNPSPHWPFFQKQVPLSEYPYIAYGLRLSHPEVLGFLQYALHSGADIQFTSSPLYPYSSRH